MSRPIMDSVWVGVLVCSSALLSLAGCGDDDAGSKTVSDAAAADVAQADAAIADLSVADTPATPDVTLDGGPIEDAPDTADASDATELPPSPLYAREVLAADHLIGGLVAYKGRTGAWLIGNSHVRFLIQAPQPGIGLALFGGNLLDADLVRPNGVPGNDRFRESFPFVAFRVIQADSIELVDDGRTGDEVVLRVRGPLAPSGIIDALDFLASDDAPFEAYQDYVVRRGESRLVMRTTVINVSDAIESVVVGDFLSFGKLLQLFAPGIGFITGDTVGDVPVLAGKGDGVSYAYAGPDGDVTVPFVDASGTVAIIEDGALMGPGEMRVFERWLAVGDGSVASVLDPLLAAAPDRGRVGGVVRDEAGDPVEGATVSALPLRANGDEPTRAESQALTGADGAYEMGLPAGDYQVVASGSGRIRSATTEVTITDGQAASADLVIGASARVTLAFTGDGPQPAAGTFPVKLSMSALNGGQEPDERLGERRIHGYSVFAFGGAGVDTIDVPPGRYRVVASHGPEFDLLTFDDVELTAGSVLDGHLARVIDPGNWLGCDFHQHTIGSLDANATLEEQVRENLGEGLGCAAITDHDAVTDIRPTALALGATPAFHGIIGDEVSINGVGHFNTFPLPLDDAHPYLLTGAKLWSGLSLGAVWANLRALPGARSILVNHPRSNAVNGYFVALKLDPRTGVGKAGDLTLGFDGIEVNAELGSAGAYTPEGWAAWSEGSVSSVPALADWFGLLNRGVDVAAIGNSDAHDTGDDAGYPRTYLRVGTSDPTAADNDAIVAAIASQQTMVSRGAFLRVDVADEDRQGRGDVVDGSAPVALHVVAEVAPWLDLVSVELYANGLLVETRATTPPAPGGTVWFDDSFELTPAADTWYAVVTRGAKSGRPVFGGNALAVWGPLYVDTDGGGFEAPGPVPEPSL